MKIGEVELQLPDYQDSFQEEEKKKLKALFGTIEGTFPMNRSYGLREDIVDYPMPVAKTILAAEIYEKTERFVPGIRVVDVDFHADLERDTLYPIVYAELNQEEDENLLEEDAADSEEDEYESD